MTPEAIRVTQSDRDLFKHLISEATNYVAADYMRHANERRIHRIRRWSIVAISLPRVRSWRPSSISIVEMARELEEHNGAEGDLKPITMPPKRSPEPGVDRPASAGKIERYEADLDELRDLSGRAE